MNRHVLLFLLISLTSVLFTTCRKLVLDEFPEFENVITVNSLNNSGDSLRVFLSVTDEFNNFPLNWISNADIQIYNQNSYLLPIAYENEGIYVFDYIAQEEDSYNLIINVPEYGQVTSTCRVPVHSEIINPEICNIAWINDNGDLLPNISFKILNNISEKKYYHQSLLVIETSGDTIEIELGIFDNDQDDDVYINKTINFQVHGNGIPYKAICKLKLSTLDENYYYFLKSLEKYKQVRETNFSNTSIIPTNLFSNIENGYGIFGACSYVISDTIPVK